MLKIVPIETRAKNITVPPLMEEIDLKHPLSCAIYGMTGSGKTVAMLNLLTNPDMYGKGFFDETYLFSVTGNSDDSFDVLKLPKHCIVTKDMISVLKKLMDKQQRAVERLGVDKAKKICVIFEDLTANKKLMNSPDFLKSFVQNRHMNMTVFACCHKYHALVRTARLNSNHHMIFPCSESEVARVCDEHSPPELSKNEFCRLIQYAFEPSADMVRPFLWINLKVPTKIRYRKSLEEILEI
jgi:hypothetical protein